MKSKNIIFVEILFLIFLACKTVIVPIKDLEYENLIYYKNGIPFSGTAGNYFDDKNSISFFSKFKDGIPSGEWQSLGFDGEIIQYGTFNPQLIDEEIYYKSKKILINRINFIEFYEGEHAILYFSLLTDEIDREVEIEDMEIKKFAISKLPVRIDINKFAELKFLITNTEF